MFTFKTKLKPWGNSFGVVIPKDKLRNEGLQADDSVRVMISPAKTIKASDLFGKLRGISTGADLKAELDELDRELDSKLFQ